MSTFYRLEPAAWRKRAEALLAGAGISITRLQGGAYRILSGDNNLTLVHDMAELTPQEVEQMLDNEARYNRTHAGQAAEKSKALPTGQRSEKLLQ
jgi:hypothetical protein